MEVYNSRIGPCNASLQPRPGFRRAGRQGRDVVTAAMIAAPTMLAAMLARIGSM
jgi:hypothetical protein